MPTILVVDDAQSNAELMKIALGPSGYTVNCAYNGQDGLNMAYELNPDLVIADLRLPGAINGWELIRILKSDKAMNHIPILVIAVEIEPMDRQRAFEAGCDDYFSKPFTIKQLRDRVANLIG